MDDVEFDDELAFDIDLETYKNLMLLHELTGEDIDVLVRKCVVMYCKAWFEGELENGDE